MEQWASIAGSEATSTSWRLGHSKAFGLHSKLFNAIEAVCTVRHSRGCSTNQRAAAWWTIQMQKRLPEEKPGHLSTLTKARDCPFIHACAHEHYNVMMLSWPLLYF